MSTLVHPSPAFPGPSSVSIDVPDGWEPGHAPGTTFAAPAPSRGGTSSDPYAAGLGGARFVGSDATWPVQVRPWPAGGPGA